MMPLAGFPFDFYPRPPRGGRRLIRLFSFIIFSISIPALREEGDFTFGGGDVTLCISIPALREEGDVIPLKFCGLVEISIPALREEGDRVGFTYCHLPQKFLSPPSARRATALYPLVPSSYWYFYPRPPRGGRRACRSCCCCSPDISIPALREEGDFDQASTKSSDYLFLSPPSARRATEGRWSVCPHPGISIPALREEGDRRGTGERAGRNIFLSPPSARRATAAAGHLDSVEGFLSPPSARRATEFTFVYDPAMVISIPALREEGDRSVAAFRTR